jgi:hypothetical protein
VAGGGVIDWNINPLKKVCKKNVLNIER